MACKKTPLLRSLTVQAFLTYLVVAALIGSIVGAVVHGVLANPTLFTSHELAHAADLVGRSIRYDAQGRPQAVELPGDPQWIFQALDTDLKYRVLDGAGATLLSSDAVFAPLAPPGRRFDPQATSFSVSMGGIDLDVMTAALDREGNRYYVQVARSQRLGSLARLSFGTPLMRGVAITVIASALAFAIVVLLSTWRMMRPLRDASLAAERIEPQNLKARLDARRMPTEIAPLVDAFNRALDRLEKGFVVQQEFLAAAAHELKTPLALMRGQVELDDDGRIDRATLLRDIDGMARQVAQLLHLAEVSERHNYVLAEVDVGAVAAEAADYLTRLADRGLVHIQLHRSADAVCLRADRSALFILFKNLLENAVQHSPSGSVVVLGVDAAGVTVGDEGAGIAQEHLDQLFKRFWRGSPHGGGAGLGLAICREIADAHGWSLHARNRHPGAEFVLRFAPTA